MEEATLAERQDPASFFSFIPSKPSIQEPATSDIMMSTTKSMKSSADHRRKESEYRYHQPSNKKTMVSAPSLLSIATGKPRVVIASRTPWLVTNDSFSSASTATATLDPPTDTSRGSEVASACHPKSVHPTIHNAHLVAPNYSQHNYARRHPTKGFDLSPSIAKARPSSSGMKSQGPPVKVATGSTQKTLVQPEGDSQYQRK